MQPIVASTVKEPGSTRPQFSKLRKYGKKTAISASVLHRPRFINLDLIRLSR